MEDEENQFFKPFSEHVLVREEDPLAVVKIHRPKASNALNESLVSQLQEAFKVFYEKPSITEICVCGSAAVFMVGADLNFFARCLLVSDVHRMLRFGREALTLLETIQHSQKPVTAWVRGSALGAGLELALACQYIVASPSAKFSLPETGLGIYPGLGGTQRTPRRIGTGLAKWMIYSGATVPAAPAAEIGLIDAVSTAATAVEALLAIDSLPARPALSTRFQSLEKLFGEHDVAQLCDPNFPAPQDPQAIRALVQMRGKAPLALRLAEHVINAGSALPLSEAIEEEYSHLDEVLRSEDARLGVLNQGRERLQFAGR